jgi:hypothetical protein
MSGEHPYHPPHPHHVHVHHPKPPPGPRYYVYVSPDEIRYREQQAAERVALALERPLLALLVAALYCVPTAYFCFRAFDEVGWWLIIPPCFGVLFAVAALVWMVNSIVIVIVQGVAGWLFPVALRPTLERMDVILDLVPTPAVMLGVPASFVGYLIVAIARSFAA